MTNDRLERRLPGLLAEIGATDPAGLLDDVRASTSTIRQRPRLLARASVDQPSPVPGLSPAMRLVLIGLLVALAAAAAIFVGSQLLRQTRPPFASDDWVFVPIEPLPERIEIASLDLLPDGRVLFTGWESTVQGVPGEPWAGWVLMFWDPSIPGQATTYPREPADPSSKPIERVVPLGDGRILVIDGWDGPLASTATAALFDPRTGTFNPAGALTAARLGLA